MRRWAVAALRDFARGSAPYLSRKTNSILGARVMSETPLPTPKPLADIVAKWRRTAAELQRIADELTACADALEASLPRS
jgi:hypothetical protein